MTISPVRIPAPQGWSVRAHFERKARLGHRQIDSRDCFDRLADFVRARSCLIAERVEDAVDLVLLVELPFSPPVIQFDNLERLHEERLTTRGCIVHNTLQLSSRVRTDRDDIAAVPGSDDRVLEDGGVLAAADKRIEALHEPAVRYSNVSPDTAELGTRGIEYIPARTNRAVDVDFEIRQLGDVIDELEQSGKP